MYLFATGTSRETDGLLDVIVHHENKSTAGSTDGVTQSTLEEGPGTFVDGNLLPAVKGRLVHNVRATSLHHHTTTDGIEGVRNDTGGGGDALSDQPSVEEGSVLGILEDHLLDRKSVV